MMKITITEKQERLIAESMLNEEYDLTSYRGIEEEIKKYISERYFYCSQNTRGLHNEDEKISMVMGKVNGLPDKNNVLTIAQLFNIMQDEPMFNGMFSGDRTERDKVLWKGIESWIQEQCSKQ